jgi:hypothetical protein
MTSAPESQQDRALSLLKQRGMARLSVVSLLEEPVVAAA